MTFQNEVTKNGTTRYRTMRFRPLRALSGVLLVAGVMGVAATSLFAQNSSSAASKAAAVPDAPASRIDFFAGYSYLGPHGSLTVPFGSTIGVPGPVSYSSINVGAIGSVTYFFDRYVGLQIEYANHPDWKQRRSQYRSRRGVVVRYPTEQIVPFVHGDAGGVRLGGPVHEPYTWGPAIDRGRRFGLQHASLWRSSRPPPVPSRL